MVVLVRLDLHAPVGASEGDDRHILSVKGQSAGRQHGQNNVCVAAISVCSMRLTGAPSCSFTTLISVA